MCLIEGLKEMLKLFFPSALKRKRLKENKKSGTKSKNRIDVDVSVDDVLSTLEGKSEESKNDEDSDLGKQDKEKEEESEPPEKRIRVENE